MTYDEAMEYIDSLQSYGIVPGLTNIINLCEKYKNSGVLVIDLVGDEIKYPTESFQDLLNMARDKKLNITIHAGEVDNLQSLESAIELNPNRIGHGISIIKDKDLLKKAKDKDILLEICPKSNIDTKIIENYQTHPIKTLKDEIKISINNDNMTTSNINISDEYENLYKNLNFTYEDFKKINIDTIEKTFLSEKDKNKLLKKYLKYYKKYLNFTKNTH